MHTLKTWQLFAICVLTWSTTWYAITFQIGALSPEVSVAVRFALAGGVVLAFCAVRGQSLRFSTREHALLALQGCFMYGVSYVCVYHAERHIVSGLVAVGYSAAPIVAGIGARWVFGTRLGARFVIGGLLGIGGVALLFWPELARANADRRTVLGVVFTVASVLLSAVGSLTASRNRVNGLPFWPALGFGMLYGALTSSVFALVQGESFALPAVPSWWIATLYLALAGSVMTFACFLTLQERVGPARSASIGVMTPILALVVSVAFEGLRPAALTFVGAGLALAGNVLMLRRD